MGIITKIEDKLWDIVENPFREKDALDLLAIEIWLKRLIEVKRKNILGKILIPNIITIIINKKKFEEYELFLGTFKSTLQKSLIGWVKEKGYEVAGEIELNFREGLLKDKPFEIFVSYGNKYKADPSEIIFGELINKRTGDIFKINQNFIILGRGEDCVIRINDPTVSRKHASLSYQHGKVILEDLESKRGTWVNHQKISKQILRQGDKIMIGGTELTYLDLSRSAGDLEYDSRCDTEMKETSLKTSEAQSKINSSNPNLLGLSYFF